MKRVLILALLVGVPFLGWAIVAPNLMTAEGNPLGSQGLNWDYVVSYRNSSAVAIAPRWLITAAHVADDPGDDFVVVGGSTYNEVGAVYHPDADFALIELDADLPAYYDLYLGPYLEGGVRDDVLMVGYGGAGTITNPTNHTLAAGDGTKRWGTNKVESILGYEGGFGDLNLGIQVDFDTGDSFNEGGVGINDSGGAVFIDDDGVWKLAGVMTDATAGTVSGNAGGMRAIAPQAYADYIYAVIPEVSPFWMVAGCFGLVCFVKNIRVSALKRKS